MLEKLTMLPYMAYYRVKWGIEAFKEDDHAISGMVVAVILVVIAVVLAIAFQNQLKGFVDGIWTQIGAKGKEGGFTQ